MTKTITRKEWEEHILADTEKPEGGLRMTETPELLPCPFCGKGETKIHEKEYWTGQRYNVYAYEISHKCEAIKNFNISICIRSMKCTREEVVKLWNTLAFETVTPTKEA